MEGRVVRYVWCKLVVLAIVIAQMMVCAQRAVAAPVVPQEDGDSPFSWIALKDSDGVSIWSYRIQYDSGFPPDLTKAWFSARSVENWELGRMFAAFGIWLSSEVQSLSWLKFLGSIVAGYGDEVRQVLNSLGLVGALVAIGSLLAMIVALKGRVAQGVWNLVVVFLILTLGTGIFADPVRAVAGPDGWVVKTAEASQSVAMNIDGKGLSREERLRKQQAILVDALIRQPAQVQNFGKVIDRDPACRAAYTKALKDRPWITLIELDSELREAVAKCDKDAGAYAKHPNAMTAGTGGLIAFGSFVIAILLLVVAGAAMLSAFGGTIAAFWLIIHFVLGLMPGESRRGLWSSVAEILVCLIGVASANLFLGLIMLTLTTVFDGVSIKKALGFYIEPMMTFCMAIFFSVMLLVIFVRHRKKLKERSAAIAAALHRFTGGEGPANKEPSRFNALSSAAHAVSIGKDVYEASRFLRGGGRSKSSAKPFEAAPARYGARQIVDDPQGVAPGDGGATGAIASSHLPESARRALERRRGGAAAEVGHQPRKAIEGRSTGAIGHQPRKALPPGPNPSSSSTAAPKSGPAGRGASSEVLQGKVLPPADNVFEEAARSEQARKRLRRERAKNVAGAALKLGGSALLGVATSGGSTVAQGAAKAVSVARKVNRARRAAQMAKNMARR